MQILATWDLSFSGIEFGILKLVPLLTLPVEGLITGLSARLNQFPKVVTKAKSYLEGFNFTDFRSLETQGFCLNSRIFWEKFERKVQISTIKPKRYILNSRIFSLNSRTFS